MANDPRASISDMLRLDGDVYTIQAGDSKQTWTVHGNLLCANSPYFKLITQKKWTEGQTRVIQLDDDDPRVVQVYLEWLYSRKIFVLNPHGRQDVPEAPAHLAHLSRRERKLLEKRQRLRVIVAEENDECETLDPAGRQDTEQTEEPSEQPSSSSVARDVLFKSYVFGEKVQHKAFQNAIIDSIIADMNTRDATRTLCYPTDYLNLAYEGTPTGSPLRKLMVDMYITSGDASWIDGTESVEFLVDLTQRLLNKNRRTHTHDSWSEPTLLNNADRKYYLK